MHEATVNLVENSMIPFLSKFVYYERMYIPYGNQHTTSIGESQNASTKTGRVAPVSPNQSLDISIQNQIVQLEHKTVQHLV